jgi:hypothetical protein
MRNEAKQLAEIGAEAAANHAEKTSPEWRSKAYNLFVAYAKSHDRFTTEQVRLSNPEFIQPPSNRAWGAIAIKCASDGIIKRVGLIATTNRTAHGANATLWQSLVVDVKIKCKNEFNEKYK